MVTSPAGFGLRVTALTRPSSNCTTKLQTRLLIREGAPEEGNGKCLKMLPTEEKGKLTAGPRWWTVITIDWLTAGRKITLILSQSVSQR
jgi:hypothetical protein